MYKYLRTANYYETDKMGIVHHSNHIRFFEEARISFMNSIGCDVGEMETRGIIIPNVDAYAKYQNPIRFGDTVEIELRLESFNGAKMRYEYTVREHESGKISATGHTTHCFVDEAFRPISLKRKFPEYYNRLKEKISVEVNQND